MLVNIGVLRSALLRKEGPKDPQNKALQQNDYQFLDAAEYRGLPGGLPFVLGATLLASRMKWNGLVRSGNEVRCACEERRARDGSCVFH